MNVNKEVAVANAGAGVNIIANDVAEKQAYGRLLVAAALIGGNAVAEPVVEVKVDGRIVKTIRGSATGLGLLNTHFTPMRVWVSPNMLVEAVIKTAPTVSPILIDLEFVP